MNESDASGPQTIFSEILAKNHSYFMIGAYTMAA